MSRLKDIETALAIKLALITHPHIGGLEIGVKAVNGIVFLEGLVDDSDQKGLAEEIALAHGGLDIRNDIRIAGEHEQGLVSRVVQQNADIESEDVTVRNRVIGDMEADARVNSVMINVEEAGGIVRLSGIQESDTAKERAGEIARRAEGVREVINDIEVRRPEAYISTSMR